MNTYKSVFGVTVNWFDGVSETISFDSRITVNVYENLITIVKDDKTILIVPMINIRMIKFLREEEQGKKL